MRNKFLLLLLFLCFGWMESNAQVKEWASGFRVGEPGGFMIRKYAASGNNAVEINMGTYGALWGNERSYRNGSFQNIGFSINVLYLWHHPTLLNPNVRTYYGFGSQYTKRDFYEKGSKIANKSIAALGGAAIGGIEYFPIDAPNLSFFGEMGFYNEIGPNPFFFHVQGGIGVRVNF